MILDICCGTGTIGICLSEYCKKVIGVEIIESAIEDAKFNCQINGVDNCEWVLGKAEDVLPEIVKREGG